VTITAYKDEITERIKRISANLSGLCGKFYFDSKYVNNLGYQKEIES